MRWIIGVLLCCAPATAFCGAKPIPPVFLDWTKPGATILDVKKILLECGWPSPDYPRDLWGAQRIDMMMNDRVLARLCVIQSGFATRDLADMKNSHCYRNPSLPACQPGAVIPTPSVERRLKSWWCTQKIERHNGGYEGCLKTALYPEKCSTDDFSIPPECLP